MIKEEEVLRKKVLDLAHDGKISCAQALALASAAAVPTMAIGKAADAAGIKIVKCQLGCFNK